MVPDALLARLTDLAADQERPGATCADALAAMGAAGVFGWIIPEAFGGQGRPAADVMAGYEHLAAANLAATFVLTQQNAAVGRLVQSDGDELKSDLLPKFAAGTLTATVGISHLTTSRQHLGEPAVVAAETAGGFTLTGSLPWCTNPAGSDLILAGGQLADGRQLLGFVRSEDERVTPDEVPDLLALTASRTTSVTLDAAAVPAGTVVAGPVEAVMKAGGGGTGSVGTSALAVGHARGSLVRLAEEAEKRPELRDVLEPLAAERERLSADVRTLAVGEDVSAGLDAQSVRTRANSLTLRSAQALLTASKGAGFVAGHPAERAVREAYFFQVWSCPAPVAEAALRSFACAT